MASSHAAMQVARQDLRKGVAFPGAAAKSHDLDRKGAADALAGEGLAQQCAAAELREDVDVLIRTVQKNRMAPSVGSRRVERLG